MAKNAFGTSLLMESWVCSDQRNCLFTS